MKKRERDEMAERARAEGERWAQVQAMRRVLCEWRETLRELPRDGDRVLAWVTWPDDQVRGAYHLAQYDAEKGWWLYYAHRDGWSITHWAPLPEPPKYDDV